MADNTEQLLAEALEAIRQRDIEIKRLSTKKVELKPSYDYIVCGSGASGAVVATRLSEDPNVNVLCLEAGIDNREDPRVAIPSLMWNLQCGDIDWQRKTVPQKSSCRAWINNQSAWPLGKMTGGCHSHNAMQYVRGSAGDYDRWASDEFGCEGWSWDDVLHYFKKSEACQSDELSTTFHNKHGPMDITVAESHELDKAFFKGATEKGFEVNSDYNSGSNIGVSRIQAFISKDGRRQSGADTMLWPNANRPNLDVLPNAMVTKILLSDDNKRAEGVQFDLNGRGNSVTVRANREVIVSCSAVHSPQLLMVSGIGPKEHLESKGIKCRIDLPVGQNLKDHCMAFHHWMTDYKSASDTRIGTVESHANWLLRGKGLLGEVFLNLRTHGFFHTGNRPDLEKWNQPDVQFYFWAHGDGEEKDPTSLEVNPFNQDPKFDRNDWSDWKPNQFKMTPIILHPKSVGSITLATDDIYDSPLIDPKYLEDPADIKTMVMAWKKLYSVLETEHMKPYVDAPDKVHNPHPFGSDEYWEWHTRHFTMTVYHPIGTCKMGPEDRSDTVVNTKLQVKGVQNLRVIDASIMPTLPSGNTCAPSCMIGEKGADMIKETAAKQSRL